jgi:hypothetical protein
MSLTDIAEVKAALEECMEDLSALVERVYVGSKHYPSEQRRYERDMEPVQRAREALAALSRLEQAGGVDGLGPEKQREIWRRALLSSRGEQAGGWRPIATAPKDGTRILVLCEFANGREPTVVRWVDSPAPAGPFGRFAWREMQDSAIAESVPKFWMPIPDAPEAIP